MFFLRPETKIVRDVEPGYIWFRSCAGNPRKFAVRGVRDSVYPAESPSAGNLRIKVKLSVVPKAKAKEQSRGEGHHVFGIWYKAERPLIERVK